MKPAIAVQVLAAVLALSIGAAGCGRGHNAVYVSAQGPTPVYAPAQPTQYGQPYIAPPPSYLPMETAPLPAPPVPVAQPIGPVALDSNQIVQLVAPVALYPDPLLAQMLPACSYPADVRAAYQWLAAYPQASDAQIDAQPWDPSVKAMAHYPDVLKTMAEHLDWAEALGAAFVYQQPAVMEAIQQLRQQAADAQNLQSTPQQQVLQADGLIEILPTDPTIIYVPVYDPVVIFVRGPERHRLTFGRPYHVGRWLDNSCDWQHHWVAAGTGWQHGWVHESGGWKRDQSVITTSNNKGTQIVHTTPTKAWTRNASKPPPKLPASLIHESANSKPNPANLGWAAPPTPTISSPAAQPVVHGKPFEISHPTGKPGPTTPPVNPIKTPTVTPTSGPPANSGNPPKPNLFGSGDTRNTVDQAKKRFEQDQTTGRGSAKSTNLPKTGPSLTPPLKAPVTPSTIAPVHAPTVTAPPVTPPVHTPAVTAPPVHTPAVTPPVHTPITAPPVHTLPVTPPVVPPTTLPPVPPALTPDTGSNTADQSGRGHKSLKK